MFSGSIGRTFQLGVKNLMLHPLRSLLTCLGIFFGVAAVIIMLAIGEGASWEAQQKYKALGVNNILVTTVKPPEVANQAQQSSWTPQVYGLEYNDADAIAATLPAVKVVVPVRELTKKVRHGENEITAAIFGTHPRYPELTNLEVGEGRWLVDADSDHKRNVAVVGAKLARRLFPFDSPIGQPLRMGTESFKVIGVLRDIKTSGEGPNERISDGVIVPLTALRTWFGELEVKSGQGTREFKRVQLQEIKVQVDGEGDQLEDNVVRTAGALRTLLKKRHKKKDYRIEVPLELLRQSKKEAELWQVFLAVIAGISLLVAGIGIMNVMLATVTERTREIGIRRALGAKRSHIVSQFLVETIVLACAGGIAGILLGFGGAEIAESLLEKRTIVIPHFAFLAFGISAAVGIVFGMYPAWRAAQMDPVEALRHE